MCETVMHKDAAWQREDLRLVLKAAEGCRVDEPVAVTLEFRAVVVTFRMTGLLSEALIGDELLPEHEIAIKVV